MSPATRKKLVFATLPIALIIAVINFTNDNTPDNTPPAPGPTEELSMAAAAKPRVSTGIEYEKYEKMGWGRDPFAGTPATSKEVPVEKESRQWRLGGILTGAGNPTAVLNGKIVSAGDRIDGALVKKIDKNSVILEINGETRTVSIAGDIS